jgi:Z1 domain
MTPYETARNLVQLLLRGEQTPPPELIREKVRMALSMLGGQGLAEGVDEEALIRDLETLYSIWMAQGTILEDKQDHIPWLPDQKAETNWDFWDRYRRYLEEEKGWSPATVDRLEQLTDSILERLEEPQRPRDWSRRGMVVGQVQSGKTSNYTGLICKAVDAGYKLIIVLAGLHNSLRSQTQLRLDEGFLGWDSQNNRAFDTGNRFIGAGLIPTGKQLRALPVTSSAEKGDFNKKIADQCGAAPGGADPILMIVKKNKTVLNNLVKWALNWASTDPQLGRKVVRNSPLLIIDDEADNASVNTKEVRLDDTGIPREEQEATAINKLIRQLLHSFEKTAYVGYTATPFANIFIHPQVRTSEHGEDLFPRHFIVNLPAPSNYVGPVQVFGLDSDSAVDLESVSGLNIVRIVEDQDEWMPTGHKKEHVPPYLPTSLKEAIRAFILSCAVRFWRGQTTAHNSMLVHVTRFKAVQELVSQLIKDELTSLQRRLRYSEGNALKQVLDEFEYLWNTDFIPTGKTIIGTELQPTGLTPAWNDIEPLLYQAAARIQVRKINDDKSKDVLDYWSSLNGLNVIAVGGDKLSRGLTLEGLSVSYYLRASKMYDTLMQMGRWFGYRPGYLDLCRLYTTDELVEWYRHITVASEELRKEFDYMANMSATPEEFGLKVRTHPSGLIITGANKMRNGTVMQLSFAGTISETYLFYKDESIIHRNLRATEDLISGLGTYSVEKNNFIWKQISGSKIVDFLTNYQSHPNARLANTRSLIDYIQAQLKQNELTSWTIALISKNKAENKYTIAGLEVGLTQRENVADPSLPEYRLSKSRLLNPPDEMLDFSPSVQEEIISITKERRQEAGKPESKSKTPDGKVIREKRNPRNGLLLLYPLDPKAINSEIPVIGFGISFPSSNSAKSVEYKVNNVYWEQEFLDSYED